MARKLPKHVAIVMDGNGRWAVSQGLSRSEGHRAGVSAAKKIVSHCLENEIKYLTLYAFSSENWKRPKTEVSELMRLLKDYLSKDFSELIEKGVRLRTIGELRKLPKALQIAINHVCEQTKSCKKLHLTLAISYGARSEILNAVKHICQDFDQDKLKLSSLTENLFESYLETRDLPDPDLFIRTSGEVRISNFLLWQLSYTELYFSNCLWPDFTPKEFEKALKSFSERDRRYGRSG